MRQTETSSPVMSYITRYRPMRSRRRSGDPYGNEGRTGIIGEPSDGIECCPQTLRVIENPAA